MENLNSTTACYSYSYCQYHLPCGYCEKMKSMCPFSGSETVKVTWGTTCLNNDGKTMQVNYCDNNAINVINKAEC